MEITLYNNKSPSNSINKNLYNATVFDMVYFKDVANIQNPIIKLNSVINVKSFNYCYIPLFNRYYFINEINIKPNDFYIVNLTCDVLESFKNDILNSKGYIIQNTNVNAYYDSGYKSEVRKEINNYYSNITMPYIKNNILVTIAGGNA